jgi:hypothetical protein
LTEEWTMKLQYFAAAVTAISMGGARAATPTGTERIEPASTAPILSLAASQGAAATANVYFSGYVLGQ